MDYLKGGSRKKMLEKRENINAVIDKFMVSQGYTKSPKTKSGHRLDSWIYKYTSAGGNKDNIKLEINYSLRTLKTVRTDRVQGSRIVSSITHSNGTKYRHCNFRD